LWFWAARKQSQFKAKQSQYYLAPRFIWGLKNRFEKTNPILKLVDWRKVLNEEGL